MHTDECMHNSIQRLMCFNGTYWFTHFNKAIKLELKKIRYRLYEDDTNESKNYQHLIEIYTISTWSRWNYPEGDV